MTLDDNKAKKVANDATITFFPVGNGDTSLITLSDRTTILIDLNVTQAASDEDDPSRYDVHAHLLKETRKDAQGTHHLDSFILTHPDQDHLRGAEEVFYLGDPQKYSKKDLEAGRIIIDELWFAPRIFKAQEELCEPAEAIREEAERRMDLYRSGKSARALPGNRIRIIGHSDNPDLKGLLDITIAPGKTLNLINGQAKSDFEFFVHGPLKKDSDAHWSERNDTSIVLQARFSVDGEERAALAMFGGDAGCAIWERIMEMSDDDSLEWDLLLAPHHCSWTFFSELPSEEEEASETILAFLDKHRQGAFIIASSKPIKDDDDNPPHYIAAEIYREKVGKEKFICTMEHPNTKKPEPLYFRISSNGPTRDRYSKSSEVLSSSARKAVVTTPKTYGQ